MGRSSRRDTEVVDTVILNQSITQYQAVLRNGDVAGANSDAFGVAMESGDAGDPVPVCRLGFCPIIVTTAADNNSAKTELVLAASGEFGALPSSGGGTAYAAASTEEATGTDGDQTGAWIDCLSMGRSRSIPA